MDPPYELAFMGKSWDNSGIAFQPATWAAIAEHLHPGGFLMAFGGSRTYHRLACAVEDAGLIIHSSIVWLNGQGFPKATRIDTQIDKAAGAEREYVGEGPYASRRPRQNKDAQGLTYNDDSYVRPAGDAITAPATPLAATWAGHRYGLQALKPCAEFVLVAQKPYSGKPVESIVSTGAGALWIDGARVATGDDLNGGAYANDKHKNGGIYGKLDYECGKFQQPAGRWPPNVILSHSEGCRRVGVKRVRGNGREDKSGGCEFFMGGDKRGPTSWGDPDGYEQVADWECVDSCAVKALADQSGELKTGSMGPRERSAGQRENWRMGTRGHEASTGTAARFYPQASWQYEIAERPFDYVQDRLAGVTPFRYQAKSSRRERDQGLEGFEEKHVAEKPGRDVCLNSKRDLRYEDRPSAISSPARNHHPCCKPLDLVKWLATLLLPPPEYAPRRILVPFAGSGSEMIGCGLAGWEEIVGVEMEAEYCAIARARLAHWLAVIQQEMF